VPQELTWNRYTFSPKCRSGNASPHLNQTGRFYQLLTSPNSLAVQQIRSRNDPLTLSRGRRYLWTLLFPARRCRNLLVFSDCLFALFVGLPFGKFSVDYGELGTIDLAAEKLLLSRWLPSLVVMLLILLVLLFLLDGVCSPGLVEQTRRNQCWNSHPMLHDF